jgi:hypothetical protein
MDADKIREFVLSHKKIIVIGFFAVVIIAGILVWLLNSQQTQEQIDIKQAITESTGQEQFDLRNVSVKKDDWYLVETVLTDSDSQGGAGYFLFKKTQDDYESILGPGTSFSPEDLYAVGAPDEVFKFFFGDEPVWLDAPEVSRVLSSNQLENTQSMISQYAAVSGVDLKKVFVEQGSFEESAENLRQPNMVLWFDFNVSLNDPDTEKFRVRISNGQGVVAGQIVDSAGNVVAEKTYSIDYSWVTP